MVGVMAVLIALALMTGLQGELRDRIVGASAHVYVFKLGDGIRDIPAEVAKMQADPARDRRRAGGDRQGAADGRAISGAAVTMKGIDPGARSRRSPTSRKSMRSGSLDAIRVGRRRDGRHRPRHRSRGDARREVGDTVRLMTPDEILTPIGPMSRADRAPSRWSASSASASSSSTASTRWSICRSRSASSARTSRDFLELRLDDMFASTEVADGRSRNGSAPTTSPRTGRDEQVALLGAVAREDGDLDHHRPDRDGRRASTSSRRWCCW